MQEIVGAEENMAIVDLDVFHKHLVLYQRRAGLPCVQILDLPLNDRICGVSFNSSRPRPLAIQKLESDVFFQQGSWIFRISCTFRTGFLLRLNT